MVVIISIGNYKDNLPMMQMAGNGHVSNHVWLSSYINEKALFVDRLGQQIFLRLLNEFLIIFCHIFFILVIYFICYIFFLYLKSQKAGYSPRLQPSEAVQATALGSIK
jgi:hypothetical protein